MTIISSKDNLRVKEARKLLTKRGRDRAGAYLIEGFHLLKEAVAAGAQLTEVFVSEDKLSALTGLDLPPDASVAAVTEPVLRSLSDEQTPQGVVAVLSRADRVSVEAGRGRTLILEDVQDPGNVGTMIRTADAAGFDAVVCLGATADVYSPKVLRAAQGSHFHIPVLVGDDSAYSRYQPLFVTTLSADSQDYRQLTADSFALVMGNEGAGVSDKALAAADKRVHIPMAGQAESLNVAVAAGILMFGIRGSEA